MLEEASTLLPFCAASFKIVLPPLFFPHCFLHQCFLYSHHLLFNDPCLGYISLVCSFLLCSPANLFPVVFSSSSQFIVFLSSCPPLVTSSPLILFFFITSALLLILIPFLHATFPFSFPLLPLTLLFLNIFLLKSDFFYTHLVFSGHNLS